MSSCCLFFLCFFLGDEETELAVEPGAAGSGAEAEDCDWSLAARCCCN